MQPDDLPNMMNYEKDRYGDYPSLNSKFLSDRKWTEIKLINQTLEGQQVLIRARIYKLRSKRGCCFIILREGFYTVQAFAIKSDKTPKQMIRYISDVPNESIIDLTGKVVIPQKPIYHCTQKVQLQIIKFFVVNRARQRLPLQVQDAGRKVDHDWNWTDKDRRQKIHYDPVKLKVRFDNRVIDLRTSAKHAIFRLESGFCQIFRQFLTKNDFIEVHTPKIIRMSKDQRNMFQLDYFGQIACLSSQCQFYKQMCIMADLQRVFEIGPAFCSLRGLTHKYLSEFVSIDIEMSIKENYLELIDFFAELLVYTFEQLNKRHCSELKIINQQFEFDRLKWKVPVVKFTFSEVVELLHKNGIEQSINEDTSSSIQKLFGSIVKQQYNTDFYVIHRYPVDMQPFNTLACEEDHRLSCSFSFFIRGQKILRGAQRINDPISLAKRAIIKGVDPNTINEYINSLKYGTYPHGGVRIGLERFVMLFCDLKNIHNSSLFPRTPRRINP